MERIHVFCMPGMAISPQIFEYLSLPKLYVIHKLEWIIPYENEKLNSYAKRICKKISYPNPILIGVSFGGILVQEISKLISYRKIIIISSVKNKNELPVSMKMSKKTNIHKLLPFQWIKSIDSLALFAFGDGIKKRIKLYQKYLSFRDPNYLKWAMNSMVNWNQTKSIEGLIHIHGKNDNVFPIKNITGEIYIIDGNHVIVLTKAIRINKLLSKLLNN